ncbi:MAG: serine/threonine protein kinase [Gemmataceae bacterium]|nr:serine/threonine protein kinase [Gemmataceae bacterium]
MGFGYQCGDRPLEGFTIKRGIGSGGFGEVYLAISDGGKTAAIKWIRGHNDREVERRGVSQCLNLSHQNLLSLFDLRTDDRGESWVIMEFIYGPTLSALVQQNPEGMPLDLVEQCFIGMANAISHLHDHGVVHRDLKPGNVFLEDGVIKVGDYGLSKTIGQGIHRDHTQEIGTCHYMAPEIATGRYDKRVDLFALGVILFEMLTGKKPYSGDHYAEVLLKQLNSRPDLSLVKEREFLPVLSRALSLEPEDRYDDAAEMLRDFQVILSRLREKAGPPSPAGPAPAISLSSPVPARFSLLKKLAPVFRTTILNAIGAVVLAALGVFPDWQSALAIFFLASLAAGGIFFASLVWNPKMRDSLGLRSLQLAIGGVTGLAACFFPGAPAELTVSVGRSGPTLALPGWARLILFYFAAMVFPRWWKLSWRRRRYRIDTFAWGAGAAWALLLDLVFQLDLIHAAVIALLLLAVQAGFSWRDRTRQRSFK